MTSDAAARFVANMNDMDYHVRWSRRSGRIAAQMRERDHNLSTMQSVVLAGDFMSAVKMQRAMHLGILDSADAAKKVGSYFRFRFALKHLKGDDLMQALKRWPWMDPDDTDPNALKAFRWAFRENEGPLTDSPEALEALMGRNGFTVYRGQRDSDPIGISWSLRKSVAQKFAQHGGTRGGIRNGVVFSRRAKPQEVLAHFVGRAESEVILEP